VPAASTIGELLEHYGLIRPRRARLRVPVRISRDREREDRRIVNAKIGSS
jgi:hypothetical protein